jgi:membrane-associated phospholipid phosphatase
MKQITRKTTTRSIYVHSPDYSTMSSPEPQDPPERTLRRWSVTPLRGGTTSEHDHSPGWSGPRHREQATLVAPLIPAAARRPTAIVAAGCAVIVAVLGVLAAGRSRGNAVDRPVDSWLLHHLGSHLRVLSDIAYIGGGQVTAVLGVLLVLACLVTRRLNGAVLVVVSFVAAAGLTEYALKPLVHETIRNSWLTYPSGHMTSLCTLIAVAWVLMLNPPRMRLRPAQRRLIIGALAILAAVVAVGLVVQIFHYFTDTIAGAAWGVCVALAAAFLVDIPAVRRLLGAVRLRPRRAS